MEIENKKNILNPSNSIIVTDRYPYEKMKSLAQQYFRQTHYNLLI